MAKQQQQSRKMRTPTGFHIREQAQIPEPTEVIQTHSSLVSLLGYNEQFKILYVQLRTGAEYAYKEVPAEVFQTMQLATSIGAFFGRHIVPKYASTLLRHASPE